MKPAKVRPIPKRLHAKLFLKEWRLHRGYSQEQLAEMVGVTQGQISQLERGLINYTQPMLEALAEALSCDPADLLVRNPADPSGIWSIWDTLDPPEKLQAVEVIKALKRTAR